jgi:hypothetical protein
MSFSFRIRCEDGSRYGLGTGWSFGRRGPRLDTSGGFGFDDVFLFEAFHVHGRLGAHAGSGTAEDTMPGLTQQEQAMLCTSKNRTWSAKRAATPVPVPGVPSPAVTVRTTTR